MSHAGTYQVYGLAAPGDLGLEYVGRTSRGLTARLGEHIVHARRRQTKVARWVKGLLDKGEKPAAVLIASCPTPQAAALVEEAVVKHLRPPANSTLTGGGGRPHGPNRHGTRSGRLVDDQGVVYLDQASAAACLGVSPSTVSQHLSGEVKRLAGRVLHYLDEDARAASKAAA